jgi:diguanylate cyclase (GGDEF)-like protein
MRWPARVCAALGRPSGLVEQTRWLFAVSVVLSLVSVLPKPLLTMEPGAIAPAVAASVVAATGWVHRYRTRRDPFAADLVETAALMALVVAFPVAVTVYVFAFAAVWFRALYGSPARAVRYCAVVSVGVLAAVPLWAQAHHGDPVAQAISMAVPLPALWLTMLVARALARSLFAREQSRRRDAALVELGHRLIGRTEPAAIHTEARRCLSALCAATPGLRALIVCRERTGLPVVHHVGWPDRAPAALPATLLPAGPAAGSVHPLPARDLAGLLGFDAGWLAVALPEDAAGWVVLGAPGGVPADATVAVRSLINQVTLALRTSEAHHELATQASVDALTGLANRSAFTAALDRRRLDPDGHLALLFLDLDDFKTVNDRMGHAAGDELLRHVAARIRGGLRPRDVCARLGGDEFAVLLPDSGDTAHAVAQRLVELVAAPISISGRAVRVGASVGLAFGSAELAAGELVQRADIAMYAAKARGKNRVETYDPGLLGGPGPAPFEAELARAAPAGELVVHYQPIVSVADGRCVAVEALVRWQHPSRGLLGPAEFVPTAERTGDIVAIGAHVLRRACAEAAGWVGPGGPLALHVNVSAVQLTDAGFREVVRECLAGVGPGAERLVLEITESAVLDSPAVGPALDELIELGALIAIDDFGTGYSALTTLRTLPLDMVKIDRSFLAGFPDRQADGAVVEAIVQVAARLGLRIVVEGVERADQQQFLRRVGADAAQGYLHMRPAPAAEFAVWLAGPGAVGDAGEIEAGGIQALPAGGTAADRIEVEPIGHRRTG